MIGKYIATLAIVVFLVTAASTPLQFVTRAHVLRGEAVNENVLLEFTVDADSTHSYSISPPTARFLEQQIRFPVQGPARVLSAQLTVTPKNVSWTDSRRRVTSTGAAVNIQLRWDTPADSPNGASSAIYIAFPELPALPGKATTIRGGGYQRSSDDRYIIREVATYRDGTALALARFAMALSAGLPFGFLLHAPFWIIALVRHKRSRSTQAIDESAPWPRTFLTSSATDWTAWLSVFGMGAFIASILAGSAAYDGFLSSSLLPFVYGTLGVALALALAAVYFSRRTALTVRVDHDGLSYARGRSPREWLRAPWSDISLTEQSTTYRGTTSYWLELDFKDGRKRLKIHPSVESYADLRTILMNPPRPN